MGIIIRIARIRFRWIGVNGRPAIIPVNPDVPPSPDNPDEPIFHTITFDSDGGEAVQSISVEHGTAIGELP